MRKLSSLMLIQQGVLVAACSFLLGAAIIGEGGMAKDAERAFVAKDVTADILPPPLYLVETRLVVSQALEGTLAPREAAQAVARLEKEYTARADHWRSNPPYGLEKELLGRQHASALAFLETVKTRLLPVLEAGDKQGAMAALADVQRLYVAHREGVDATVAAATQFAESSLKSFDETQSLAMYATLIAFLIAVSTTTVLSVWIRKAVWRLIGDEPALIATWAMQTAEGDFSRPFRSEHPESVAGSLEKMRQQISDVVGTVRGNAESVASASTQIAQGNMDLSSRTEQQASALQQTSSTMEELGSTVRNNAENASQANQLAQNASDVAVRGGEVVGRVIQTMKSINESSQRIADIIGTIDGIAFQTNILALNAAVEAARAGEQGRGFAVVAGEVRSLAQRSAEAAKEIKALIGTSVERVDQGSALVDQAGRTMQEVVHSIRRVTDIVGEITAASGEQAAGVSQVGQAVSQMDQAMQQNAALVEENAAAAESLKQQAQMLLQSVAAFRLQQGDAGAPATIARPLAATWSPPAPPLVDAAIQTKLPSPASSATPRIAAPQAAAKAKQAAESSSKPAPAAAGAGGSWESF